MKEWERLFGYSQREFCSLYSRLGHKSLWNFFAPSSWPAVHRMILRGLLNLDEEPANEVLMIRNKWNCVMPGRFTRRLLCCFLNPASFPTLAALVRIAYRFDEHGARNSSAGMTC